MGKHGKNIVVTGGLGFIGRSLVKKLLDTGEFNINIIDKKKRGTVDDDLDKDRVYYINKNTADITGAMNELRVYTDQGMYLEDAEIIVHLGEFARVEQSLYPENTSEVIQSNIAGTGNLIKNIVELKNNSTILLYAGSSTRFSSDISASESLYAWTKYSNTELVKNLSVWFDMPTAVMYFYNVYGEGENSETVVESFRQKFLANKKIDVYGGDQTRRFTYIDDVANNILLLINKLLKEKPHGESYHMISESILETKIIDLAKMFYDNDCSKLNIHEPKNGCRAQSVDGVKLSTMNCFGKYERSIDDYVKSIRAEKDLSSI